MCKSVICGMFAAVTLLGAACVVARAAESPELPPAVAEIVAAHQAEVLAIEARAAESLAAAREKTLAALRELKESFAKEGKAAEADAVAAQIRRLNAKSVERAAVAAPVSPAQWRGRVGESYFCELTGDAGVVWGTDVYTDDSSLAAAAVHAGALKMGETGVVKITIAAPQDSYEGTSRNGIDTGAWGDWGGAFRIERAKDADIPPMPMGDGAAAIANPGTLVSIATRPGEVFLIDVTGAGEGAVWGSDVYTSDSAIAAAAVHAGVLKVGERGAVKVVVAEGQGEYAGSERNGVASRPWGSYALSYRFAHEE